MKNIAVFISGRGSNLKAILDYQVNNSDCDYRVKVIYANKAKCLQSI